MPKPWDVGGQPLCSPQLCCKQASPLLPLLFQHFDVLIIYFLQPSCFHDKMEMLPVGGFKTKG